MIQSTPIEETLLISQTNLSQSHSHYINQNSKENRDKEMNRRNSDIIAIKEYNTIQHHRI